MFSNSRRLHYCYSRGSLFKRADGVPEGSENVNNRNDYHDNSVSFLCNNISKFREV